MKAVITISDLHVGSTTGLCHPKVNLVDGGYYTPNKFQSTLYKYWRNFWGEYVPAIVKGADKVIVVINGDILDGIHHDTVNVVSNSWAVQEYAAMTLLQEIPKICPVQLHEFYVVKGTEVHTGKNGESEERIARSIYAVTNEIDESASYQWRLDVDGVLFQFAHHIGTTSSAAYESSAPMRELVAAMVEAAAWGLKLPDVLVRSHRHRFIEVPIPTEKGRIRVVITPGWQLRTPFVERIDRMRMPHIGGVVFRVNDGRVEVCEKLYKLPQPAVHKI